MQLKKNDNVLVIAGKDKGKVGKILTSFPKDDRVIVEGVNMLTKHKKASKEMQQAGIIHQEGSIHVSNVMIYCSKCKKGVRISKDILKNGNKIRVCNKCGENLD